MQTVAPVDKPYAPSVQETGEMDTPELISTLDATLAEIRSRLDAYVERGAEDIVAADEGFALAGIVYASVRVAEEHASKIRTLLEDANRRPG